jgi:hypothetical protein
MSRNSRVSVWKVDSVASPLRTYLAVGDGMPCTAPAATTCPCRVASCRSRRRGAHSLRHAGAGGAPLIVDALASSWFALLDQRGNLRLVIDFVEPAAALCLALTCTALRDALWQRFPRHPPLGHESAAVRALWQRFPRHPLGHASAAVRERCGHSRLALVYLDHIIS